MENKMEAIICSNVNKSYGKKEVLKNIDFTLEKGKIYGLIAVSYTHLTLPTN